MSKTIVENRSEVKQTIIFTIYLMLVINKEINLMKLLL